MTLTVKDQVIEINPNIIQRSKRGRDFKLTRILIDYSRPPVYINRQQSHPTYYFFKYLDDNSRFALYFNGYNQIECKLDEEAIDKLCQ